MRERVLFDVNVLLDVIENRSPFVNHSGPALEKAANRLIDGYIAASSVDTLAFLLRRNASVAQTYAILEDVMEILTVAPVTDDIVRTALQLRWPDPEDAIIYCAAKAVNCTKILTRNVRDFKVSADAIDVITPDRFSG